MHRTSPFLFAARPRQRRVGIPSLTAVVVLHAAALFVLLQHAPVREALGAAAPIMVSLVSPPRVQPTRQPAPEVEPPKPAPKPVRRATTRPIIAAPVEAPSPIPAPAPPPEPPPPAATPQPAAPPQTMAAAPALPVVPPSFSADYLRNPAPAYPPLARRLGEQGKVVLHVLVTAEGEPDRIEVSTSSGSPRLDGAALGAVKRWKFIPARQGDRPVPAWVLVPISFNLRG
jgi:protein TonB